MICVRSDWASGARRFSFVGESTHGAVGTLGGECKSGVIGKGTGWATFALEVGRKTDYVGISTRRAGFASGLRILIGVRACLNIPCPIYVYLCLHDAQADLAKSGSFNRERRG